MRKDAPLLVLSASRRTDLVRWYPDDLMRALSSRYPPERVHSVVIITKWPDAVLAEPLTEVLAGYEQTVVQVTITGLGASEMEPNAPPPERALAVLPDLVRFTGNPERVTLRVDPIIHWRQGGRLHTNLDRFATIVSEAARFGVTRVKTSLVTPYRKALREFTRVGWELIQLSGVEREDVLCRLEAEARRNGVLLEFCCEPTRPPSACIDPDLLTRLHPRALPARADRTGGQRPTCACGHSVDLAWYATHPCPGGCRYCYANPIRSDRASPPAR